MLTIKHARPTGGKAGKGHNKTSTIQVFDNETNCIVKQFRYSVDSTVSWKKALAKAKDYLSRDDKWKTS